MKRTLLKLLLTFLVLLAKAQTDSSRLAKADSITSTLDDKTDSLNQKLQGLQNPKVKIPFSNKADSLKGGINAKLQKPNELAGKLKHKADNLNPQQEVEQYPYSGARVSASRLR